MKVRQVVMAVVSVALIATGIGACSSSPSTPGSTSGAGNGSGVDWYMNWHCSYTFNFK